MLYLRWLSFSGPTFQPSAFTCESKVQSTRELGISAKKNCTIESSEWANRGWWGFGGEIDATGEPAGNRFKKNKSWCFAKRLKRRCWPWNNSIRIFSKLKCARGAEVKNGYWRNWIISRITWRAKLPFQSEVCLSKSNHSKKIHPSLRKRKCRGASWLWRIRKSAKARPWNGKKIIPHQEGWYHWRNRTFWQDDC